MFSVGRFLLAAGLVAFAVTGASAQDAGMQKRARERAGAGFGVPRTRLAISMR
jgi:hypothetical protein